MGKSGPFFWIEPKNRTIMATIEMVIMAYMSSYEI
jgi:hypothetical protein